MTFLYILLVAFTPLAAVPFMVAVDRWRSDRWMKNIDRDLRATREALR